MNILRILSKNKEGFILKRKYLMLLLILVMVVAAGCNGDGNETKEESKWKDGTYFATYSHTDGHNWRPYLTIIIADGKIESGWMDYQKPDGTIKSKDEGYGERMLECTGVEPTEVYTSFNDDFIKNQDLAKVDAVSGASHSSHEVQEMGAALLKKAETGDTSEIVLEMDNTYKASNPEFDDHGWKGSVALTYEGGKITAVAYEETNEDGIKKSEDEGYNERFQSTDGLSVAEVYEALATQMVVTQDSDAVDAVAGATGASDNFKDLVKEAMAKRVPYAK